jgi:uncharacterized protein YpmS
MVKWKEVQGKNFSKRIFILLLAFSLCIFSHFCIQNIRTREQNESRVKKLPFYNFCFSLTEKNNINVFFPFRLLNIQQLSR